MVMAHRNERARSEKAEDRAAHDALAYWYTQENAPLDLHDLHFPAPEPDVGDRMASGWWLLPILLLSVPAWIGLAYLVF